MQVSLTTLTRGGAARPFSTSLAVVSIVASAVSVCEGSIFADWVDVEVWHQCELLYCRKWHVSKEVLNSPISLLLLMWGKEDT